MSTVYFFFFNDTATTEIYTLSLHDALPISQAASLEGLGCVFPRTVVARKPSWVPCRPSTHAYYPWYERADTPHACGDRKSTRLNSSHANISYAVFCLKKKTHNKTQQ